MKYELLNDLLFKPNIGHNNEIKDGWLVSVCAICHTLYDPPRTSARLPLYRQDDTIVKRPWGSQRDTMCNVIVCVCVKHRFLYSMSLSPVLNTIRRRLTSRRELNLNSLDTFWRTPSITLCPLHLKYLERSLPKKLDFKYITPYLTTPIDDKIWCSIKVLTETS